MHRAKPMPERTMFTSGPASDTYSDWVRGLRSRDTLTGTGLAYPNAGRPAKHHHQGQQHGPKRVDVSQRIERQPAIVLRGRVAKIVGDPAVAHLVQDH